MKKTLLTSLMAMMMTAQISAQDKAAEDVKAPVKKAVEAKEEHVVLKGVVPGKWTQDYAAGLAYAKEHKLPLLLNFTGSDWCGWCKLMEKNVFNKAEWAGYAKDAVVMVFLDFPRDKSLVPAEYVERNDKLKAKFGVRGFPTYIILDGSESEVGRLGAGREKTPASVQTELEAVLRFTASGIEKTASALGGEAGENYRKAFNKMKTSKDAAAKLKKATEEAVKKLKESTQELQTQLESAASKNEAKMKEIRIAALTPEQKAEYTKLQAELAEANKAFQDFLATKPARNAENQKKYQALSGAASAVKAKLASF